MELSSFAAYMTISVAVPVHSHIVYLTWKSLLKSVVWRKFGTSCLSIGSVGLVSRALEVIGSQGLKPLSLSYCRVLAFKCLEVQNHLEVAAV